MVCKVRYLNSSGILVREIPGISRLAAAFPAEWLLYASLQCYPPRSHPIEIDVLLVMDDRVLLLELKDFYGDLTCNGDQWMLNGRPRGRSPVDMMAEKARKVRGILAGSIPNFSKYPVDSRVVLTGSATKANLSDAEKPSIWSLDEACLLGDAAQRPNLLPSTLMLKKAYQFSSDFDRITRNPRQWAAAEGVWDGYRVVEEDVVVHPASIWREHRAERVKDPRIKGLLRMWAFDRLPPGLNSADQRVRIADRELRAFGHLHHLGSPLARDGRILLPTGEDKEEILTQHFELRMLPKDHVTLDRYLVANAEELTSEDRVTLATAVLGTVAELHGAGIAHRDLGPRCIWVADPTRLALSGLMSCQVPDEESLSDWFSVLRGYSGEAPEDSLGAAVGTAKQRDVYSTAHLVSAILGRQGQSDAGGGLPDEFTSVGACLDRALSTDPSQRYQNAEQFADDFTACVERQLPERVDQSFLDRVETDEIPYVKYPQVRMLKASARVNVYVHRTAANEDLVTKVWLGLRRGSAAGDIAMARLFEGAGRLKVSPVRGLPEVVDFALSPIGPFVVYRYRNGTVLDEVGGLSVERALDICAALLTAVDAVHAMGLIHGDIAGRNILLDDETSEVLLLDLFDLSTIGDGKVRTLANCPDGWERLTEEQIDRFAALKVCSRVLGSVGDDRLAESIGLLGRELERDAIETLEPALLEFARMSAELRQPPLQRFKIGSDFVPAGPFTADHGVYHAWKHSVRNGGQRYIVSGIDRALYIETSPTAETRHWIVDVPYSNLTRRSGRAVPLRIALEVVQGTDDDVDELLSLLVAALAGDVEEPTADSRVSGKPVIDVKRLWRESIDLEGSFYPEVEILEDRGMRGGFAAFAYDRLSGNFDFDGESTVEVRLLGRRVGELDQLQTDERTIVIKNCNRYLNAGDRLSLVDRRAKASLDRRRKAVDRILSNAASLPKLIDYFACDAAPEVVDYGTEIAEQTLDDYLLNDGQKAAFRNIVRHGPVGFLQGPPGTGKTHFIAALVHWLVTEAGAQKILIASQSHEAVNNAIEKLVDLLRRQHRRTSLLRIGSKGISRKISPYHTDSARETFRVKFESAFKNRIIGLTNAIGLKREFVADAIEIERQMGRPSRRIKALLELDDDGMTPEDQRRYATSLRSAINAFRSAAKSLTGSDIEIDDIDGALSEAYLSLLESYPDLAPADVARVREVIKLSLEWLDALSTSHRNFDEFLVKTRTVISATCVGAGQNRIRIDAKAYDWVIVDEAARCTPGELAVPIQVGRRLLLVGDHLQLRPMVHEQVLKEMRKKFTKSSRRELSRSDFERVFESDFGKKNGQILNEQYRMDDEICRLVSKTFYEPHNVRLSTSPLRKANPAFGRSLPKPVRRPVSWIDTGKSQMHVEKQAHWNRHSFWNQAEVNATIAALQRISKEEALVGGLVGGDSETPIGVICMYSAQKVMIEQAFARTSWDAKFRRLVRIDTVDSYQGKENDIVIVSLVRCNAEGQTGHVGTDNRVNVAFSRAKERLVIVGSRRMWDNLTDADPVRRVSKFFYENPASTDVISAGEL